MSKLQELINRLCPDGVPYIKIGEIVTVLRGKRLTKSELEESGDFPVYHGGLEPLGYYHSKNRDANSVMIINVGASAGTVGFCNQDFWSSDGCFCLSKSDKILPKFLYYFLSSRQYDFVSKVRYAGIPTLDGKVINDYPIPVPPMEVQEEIVKILDRFAEYSAELQAKLQAELQARKEQYEYYRNLLLTFNPSACGCGTDGEQKMNDVTIPPPGSYNIAWKPLGEICKKICSGGTPLTSNKDYYHGNIPWMRTQEVDWKDIYDTEIKISEEAVANSSAKLIPANCVIIAMYGATAAKCCINKIPLTTNQACLNLEIDPYIANFRFVYQWICKNYQVLKNMGEGSQSNLNASKIKNFLIPIPPLEVQEKIAGILDRFEALVNDLSAGLPAEIAAVKERYEYYRNKLLTFKQIS